MLNTVTPSRPTGGWASPAPTWWQNTERVLKRRVEHLYIGEHCQSPIGYPDAKIVRTRNKRYEVHCAGRCETFRTPTATLEYLAQIKDQRILVGVPVQLRLL